MSQQAASPDNKKSNSFLKAVLTTGLLAGTLDAIGASVHFFIKTGRNPIAVFRYIASATFGKKAYTGSYYGMAAWGLFFHFLIAMSFTVLFFLIYPVVIKIVKNKFIVGVLFGLFTWLVMNLVVVPLSLAPKSPFNITNALTGAGILILAIGLPVSLMVDKYYNTRN